jgi:type I restriction enzyme S subunit
VDKKSVEGERPVRLCNYVDVYNNDQITADMEFMEATATDTQIEQFSIRGGDVIITKDSETWDDIAVPAYVSRTIDGLVCGYHLALVRPNLHCLDGAYLARCFAAEGLADQFRIAANGITRYGLDTQSIKCAVFPVPPLPEQRAIATFLDRETARIDALMGHKEHLIALLEEKRRAVISHAVTRGLDLATPLRDSGSPYWGRIPAHWRMTKLRHLVPDYRQIMYGIVLPGPHVDDGIPIVKGGNCEPGRLKLELMSRTAREIEAGYERSRLRDGDIVYAIRGSLGAAEIVPEELSGANLTQDAARIAPKPGVHIRWLLYTVRSVPFFAKLEAGALGATIRGINIRDLKRAELPCPEKDEQARIADYLDEQTRYFDSLTARVSDGIARLQEYRIALISAAVTGQIDVRGEVTP